LDLRTSLASVLQVDPIAFAAPSSVNDSQIALFNLVYDQFRAAQIGASANPRPERFSQTRLDNLRLHYFVALDGSAGGTAAIASSRRPDAENAGASPDQILALPEMGQVPLRFVEPNELAGTAYWQMFPSAPIVACEADVTEYVSAVKLLERYLPAYCRLFARQIASVVFLEPRPGFTESGSSPSHPNLVYMSGSKLTGFYAETIVHEGSHQVMQFLEVTCDLFAEQGLLYHNPILGRDRPIRGVAAAYHAFGLIAATAPFIVPHLPAEQAIELAAKSARFSQGCEVLARHLEESPELTSAGRDFYFAVRDEIARLSDRRLNRGESNARPKNDDTDRQRPSF
jgi:HEXXH motif-containing protein